jgi:hypothetical protein
MKKHFFSFLLPFICFTLSAQKEVWFEAGFKGGGGLSFLYNNNIANDDHYDYKLTPMYGVGGKLSANFGPYHGIVLEGMYNFLGQDFEYKLPGSGDLQNEISWKSLDAYLLYRFIRNKGYVEVGPMYSFVQSVEQTDNGTELADPSHFYEKNYLAGVLGFGSIIANSGTFSFGLGLRLHYGFTDFVNEEGQAMGYPNPMRQSVYAEPKTTHPAYAMFLLEFNFGIGYYAKTCCSKRMHRMGGRRRG